MNDRLPKSRLLLPFFMVGTFLVIGSFQTAGQSRSPQKATPDKSIKTPSKHSGPLPVADLAATLTETPAEQIHRQSRENRIRNYFPFITDPGKLVDGQQESVMVVISDYVGVVDSFPASASAAVIIGTVSNAKGFVSQHRTYVYSDFQIRVDEILKQDVTAGLAVGGQVVASRTGAAVRFPSGHLRHFLALHQGMPKIAVQYVFFLLKPDPAFPEYFVSAAYALGDGKAHPLDDYHPELEGIDAAMLVAKVKSAIAASQN